MASTDVRERLLLGAGCSIGAVFGLYGQLLLSHALASVTGFPVVFSVGLLVALESVALVSVAAAAIVAVPGYLAAGVPASAEIQVSNEPREIKRRESKV